MKVLDPQTALLTTGEVHQFLIANKPRAADKKIGSYKSVNLHNYDLVRKDLESYLEASTPYVSKQPPPEEWMNDLLRKLKKYELTKTEVFSLINLGIGLNKGQSAAKEVDEEAGDDEESVKQEDGEEGESGNDLDRVLFEIVVEKFDKRFGDSEGEERVAEILSIFKETIMANRITNGS